MCQSITRPIYLYPYLSVYLSFIYLCANLSITICICQSINQYSIAADQWAGIGLVFVWFFFVQNGTTQPLFVYFWSFQTNNRNFHNKPTWKMSCPSSIRHRDSNPWPLKHELSPITTRPGLLPSVSVLLQFAIKTFIEPQEILYNKKNILQIIYSQVQR